MYKLYKQPNGKYCDIRCGSILSYNITEEDIVERMVADAKREAEKMIETANHFGNIISEIAQHEGYVSIDNRVLGEMGFTEGYRELVKYVPRKPINQSYAGCDFTTYANCPSCQKRISNCMGNGDKKCSCGQMLDWD